MLQIRYALLSSFFFSTKPLVYKSTRQVTHHWMQMKRKPKFGQNFLVDDAARHAIVDALGDLGKRTVIEIGPGHGAITEILAGRCHRLIALELDRALAAELTFRFRDQPQVQIIEGDVLKADLRALVPEGETADVIGNLPYYITSDILLQLFAAGSAGTGRTRRPDDAARGGGPRLCCSRCSRLRAALGDRSDERSGRATSLRCRPRRSRRHRMSTPPCCGCILHRGLPSWASMRPDSTAF